MGWFSEGICKSICIPHMVCGLRSSDAIPCSDVAGLSKLRQLFKLADWESENSGFNRKGDREIYVSTERHNQSKTLR